MSNKKENKDQNVSMEDILSVLLREMDTAQDGITEKLLNDILQAETDNIENLPAAKTKIESLVEDIIEKG